MCHVRCYKSNNNNNSNNNINNNTGYGLHHEMNELIKIDRVIKSLSYKSSCINIIVSSYLVKSSKSQSGTWNALSFFDCLCKWLYKMTAVRFPIVREQRQDVSGFTSLEKTKQRYLILILPTYPKYSCTFSCYLSLSSHQLPLPSYTRVVEWVLGRPLEL